MTQPPVLDRFAGGYDPAKYRLPIIGPRARECECGALLTRTVYKLGGKDLCLSCAMDEAGIETERVDADC